MSASRSLLVRGIRWRLGASLLTVLTATVAVAAAVLGPLYLRTAGDSVVRTTIASAPVYRTGVTILYPGGQAAAISTMLQAERKVEDAGGTDRWFGAPITTVSSGVSLVGQGSTPYLAALLHRTGVCSVLHFQAGGCHLGPGDTVISGRTASQLGAKVGSVIPAGVRGDRFPVRLRVTGIYAVPDVAAPYWWGVGAGYFPFGITTGPNRIDQLDPLITSQATALSVPAADLPDVVGQLPLRSARVGLGDEGALRAALAAATGSLASQGLTASSQLPALLAGAGSQRHDMSTIVVVAAVQLVLLALWVLTTLLLRNSDARQSEIRVARLRGFPPSSLFAVTAAEPAILCLIGVPVGVAIAFGVVLLARNRVLDPAAAVTPDGWVFAALGAAVVAIAGAVALGTARMLTASGVAAPSGASVGGRRANVIADVVLLVLSLVATLELTSTGALGSRNDPIAAAAPGLIALGMAVVAVHLVLLLCRFGVNSSAHSRRVASFLAVRQIARRPVVLRQARVLVIALCLACFATAAWSVARTNRAEVARFTVGAPVVATVTPQGTGLERAVDKVDPGGRYAMAAVRMATQSSVLLAVDAHRLPAVAAWPAGISRETSLAASRAIDPPTAPAVTLSGRDIEVTATASGAPSPPAGLGRTDLALWLFNPQAGTNIVDAGPLRPGTAVYRASLAFVCPGSCQLTGVGLLPAPGAPLPSSGVVDLHIHGFAAGSPAGGFHPVAADLSTGEWTTASSQVSVASAPGSLALAVPASAIAGNAGAIGSATPPLASPADTPGTLPGVVTNENQLINGGGARAPVPVEGLDGNTLSVRSAVSVSALPQVGGDAVMVDLDLLRRLQVDSTSVGTSDQVWLGPAAPRDALARLQAAGLHIDSVQRSSAVFHQEQQTGPALADDFLLVATITALLVAAASTLGALGGTIRQRATELTALEVSGVRRPVLARSLALESFLLAGTALFGAAAGVIAAVLALPALPELPAGAAVIPLQFGLPGALVAAVALAVVAVVLLSAGAVGLTAMRRMSPLLLRTAPNDTAA